ncbi:AraC-like DNA-binding protein [Nocardioides cavernae]|uniref:AraC-like DNA-binding protein n=1 Tax=Nocardioides cavernae TaxID=1921566 RepID=A0A7Y9H2P2_9ACTN|nr:AraC family transcriptional regulator [Nocardioides cavernae]NYE36069.1 AraC-like DNA-binding protein [Nocardioides cavernae]
MARPLLSAHRRMATTDMDEARHEVAEHFCPHLLEPTGRDARLDMVHNAAPIGSSVTLNYLTYGSGMRITPGTFDDFYLVKVPVAGTARVRVGSQVVHSTRNRASVGSPTEPVDMVWGEGCAQLLIYFRRGSVEDMARADGDSAPVVFEPAMDLQTPSVRSWLRLVHLAVDDVESGGALFGSALAAVHFEQTLISGLLAMQPNSAREVEQPTRPCPPVVRTVVDLIEGQPEHEWTVVELARRAGVAPRTLQEAFQRELGMSPLERLRRTRMERARRDLVAADATQTSVTDVAVRWGFFHLGRFAQTYRARYQELPSTTLAR